VILASSFHVLQFVASELVILAGCFVILQGTEYGKVRVFYDRHCFISSS